MNAITQIKISHTDTPISSKRWFWWITCLV